MWQSGPKRECWLVEMLAVSACEHWGDDKQARVMPVLGVMFEPCCSLMVTVLLDGSDQVMVKGVPATTWRPPVGMLMALFFDWAATSAASARMGAKNFIVAWSRM